MHELTEFVGIQQVLLNRIPRKYKRFLFEQIDWGERLVGLVGARGSGKSTLLLQFIAEQADQENEMLYLSADHVRVEAVGLYELGSTFLRMGGRTLIVDEVHKTGNWAQVIKSLYDSFPDAQIVFSGSSTMRLQSGKGDLSRRAVYYHLPALSFREYLILVADRHKPAIALDTLLAEHGRLAAEILRAGPILGLFRDYLHHGAYPFVIEGVDTYLSKLQNVIEKVLYEDITSTTGMRVSGVPVMKRILWRIASSPPHELNMERLSSDLGVAKQTVYNYIDHLERAGLLMTLLTAGAGSTLNRRGTKLMLANTNLLRAVGRPLNLEDPIGTIRETFLASQLLGAGISVRVARKGDFVIADGIVVEVGGRWKTRRQVADYPEAYVVKDDIEVGAGRAIPLWLFGFLY